MGPALQLFCKRALQRNYTSEKESQLGGTHVQRVHPAWPHAVALSWCSLHWAQH